MYFAETVTGYLNLAIDLAGIVIVAWALIHCALQRSDAFTALVAKLSARTAQPAEAAA